MFGSISGKSAQLPASFANARPRRAFSPSSCTKIPCGVFSSTTTDDLSRNAFGNRIACEFPD
ncbi:MAG: hypothetical protein H7Y06_09635 [Opitutaceae bacterium]|nr:hypothetical protein [Opitutaceae bacterium]